ncbi:multidrug ABC transporter permease/ATP-binding protein [Campylobacter sp. RM9344]|uniref:Multidrug ABC transporter permease/ATP-binding protein n=1 Tax=Campylobacter californiensis TaxID=1032243 RepID=A0AAW3ZT56_9BACT|nr:MULTISPECIES: multidrug ABC transporter permease/ATP-binding protein [unclassified Campylobacter]MBE2984587.1 multidrug ABC transporter permease/ATP-binding protein [Campylobacter sp. RM6883]MBE2995125.1 multidrug ABC transporter permease/ATP-binding protein [Campylobacter sp. RM6913]MBE3029046.1 multidrug ABC transporter permease/ATP-binding protein [Campylobacter sp. RM9344]MBE3607403.1 multidrug ABC transporter permease/ATP-binding protein [Campylobacter sp. RM9337]QCD50060.1 multidrug A
MIKSLIKNNILSIVKIVFLTLIFSALGIGVLSFINERLLGAQSFDAIVAVQFISLLLLFFLSSVYANITLTTFGHGLVFEIRKRLVKQILDTSNTQIDTIGKAKLIASLNSDIRTISFAFMSAPGLIQGSVFIMASGIYMFYISPKLFTFIFIWLGFALGISAFLMRKIHYHFSIARKNDDELQQSYNDAVEGHAELTLNRSRAKICFNELNEISDKKRKSMVKADVFHAISDNFTNVMLLGAVGMCVLLCVGFGWASLQTAVTVSLTILFLRGSLIAMVGSIPTALSAKVSMDKISNLNLTQYTSDKFDFDDELGKEWKKIEFKNVGFSYPDKNFSLKDVNLSIKRGETVFVIGKNGSGKSTFSNILCGLLAPTHGEILLDEVGINDQNLRSYQSNVSAILSNFYLFSQTLSNTDEFADKKEMDELLRMLCIDKKVKVIDDKLSTTALSQGQRKRLGLFIALLEKRSLLVLDEWAADQDPIFKRVFYREILPFLKQKGVSIVAISHDDAYFDVADRILLVKEGKISELTGDEREKASKDAVERLERD